MSSIIKLGEACTVRRGKTITKKTSKQGDIPVIAGGKKPAYFHSEHDKFESSRQDRIRCT